MHPQTRPALRLLGRKKRVEDAREYFAWNAAPVVAVRERYSVVLFLCHYPHHTDRNDLLSQFQQSVKDLCKSGKILSKAQIINLLGHIEDLTLEFFILSPKKE